jgi:hypothetical protein
MDRTVISNIAHGGSEGPWHVLRKCREQMSETLVTWGQNKLTVVSTYTNISNSSAVYVLRIVWGSWEEMKG